MTRELVVLLNGVEVGSVIQFHDGKLELRYAGDWAVNDLAFPLSLSMPTRARVHGDSVVRPFLEGLLPDNDSVLAAWGLRFGVSARNPFSLLAHVGEDIAGAAQLVLPDRVHDSTERPGSVEWLNDEEIGDRLRELLVDHSAWRSARDIGHFSLAGAQPKTALLYDEGRWGVPSGRIPTTHILKPPALDLEQLALNEHLCLSLAGALDLPAANTEVVAFAGQSVIVVRRYDRRRTAEGFTRIHQEDFCQAAAVSPINKYENEGGPGTSTIVKLLRENSSNADTDIDTFVASLALNWAIGAPDAHAKNYSVLISPGPRVRLAPLYDVLSVLPYPKAFFPRKVKLAMKIGGEYRLAYLRGRHWDRFAAENRLDTDRVRGIVRSIVEQIPDRFASVCAKAEAQGFDRDFLARFRDAVVEHAKRCFKALDQNDAPD